MIVAMPPQYSQIQLILLLMGLFHWHLILGCEATVGIQNLKYNILTMEVPLGKQFLKFTETLLMAITPIIMKFIQ